MKPSIHFLLFVRVAEFSTEAVDAMPANYVFNPPMKRYRKWLA